MFNFYVANITLLDIFVGNFLSTMFNLLFFRNSDMLKCIFDHQNYLLHHTFT